MRDTVVYWILVVLLIVGACRIMVKHESPSDNLKHRTELGIKISKLETKITNLNAIDVAESTPYICDECGSNDTELTSVDDNLVIQCNHCNLLTHTEDSEEFIQRLAVKHQLVKYTDELKKAKKLLASAELRNNGKDNYVPSRIGSIVGICILIFIFISTCVIPMINEPIDIL